MLSPGPEPPSLWRVPEGTGPVPRGAHAAHHTIGAEFQPASGTWKILISAAEDPAFLKQELAGADREWEYQLPHQCPTLAPALQEGPPPDHLITQLYKDEAKMVSTDYNPLPHGQD